MKSLLLRYMKSNYKVDDFGRGKTTTSKKRNRRILKKSALAKFLKEVLD